MNMEEQLYDNYILNTFTKDGEEIELEVDQINTKCISSKNDNFSLDENGNLIVNSIAFKNSEVNGIIDLIYPVGSIYMSVNQTNPSILFGGSWEQIQNRFLIGAGDNYSINSLGGQSSVISESSTGITGGPSTNTSGSTVLTLNQIPSHQHNIQGFNNSGSSVSWTDRAVTYGSTAVGYNVGVRTNYQGGGAGHTHTLSSHTHSLDPHAHSVATMPPYLAVGMWKRTA